jgi:hypothetical protein
MSMKHVCGQCTKSFSDESAYLKHNCPVAGGTPKSPGLASSIIYKAPSLLEKKILTAVQAARQEKRDYHA